MVIKYHDNTRGFMSIISKIAIVAVAMTITTVALLLGPPSAKAANGTIGQRETVCADDLYLRTQPNNGAFDGTLVRGETFLVKGPRSGGDVYGFAYGHINRSGWVRDGYFC